MHVGVLSQVCFLFFCCEWNMLEIVEWFQKWSKKNVGLFQRAGRRRSLTDSTLIEARVALETYALGCLCGVILCMATPLFTFHQSWRKCCRRLMRSKRFHWVNVVVLILYMKTSIINRQLQLSNPILFIHASQMFLQIYRPPENERMLFWKGTIFVKGHFIFQTIGFQQIYLWFPGGYIFMKTKLQIFGAKANSGTRCAGPAGVRSHLEAVFFIIDFLKERNDSKSYISTVLNVYYNIYISTWYVYCILM